MPLDVQTMLNSVIQVLRDNTGTFSASLTSSTNIVAINAGDARSAPVTVDQYPHVLVQLLRETEEFDQIGQRNNKVILEYGIVPLIYNATGHRASDADVRTMAKNIKTVLKNNITLSATALSSMPETVDYFVADLDGTYLSAALITFKAEYRSS